MVILNSFVLSHGRNKALVVKSIDLGAWLPVFNLESTTYWQSALDKVRPLSVLPCPQATTWEEQWLLVRVLGR